MPDCYFRRQGFRMANSHHYDRAFAIKIPSRHKFKLGIRFKTKYSLTEMKVQVNQEQTQTLYLHIQDKFYLFVPDTNLENQNHPKSTSVVKVPCFVPLSIH